MKQKVKKLTKKVNKELKKEIDKILLNQLDERKRLINKLWGENYE